MLNVKGIPAITNSAGTAVSDVVPINLPRQSNRGSANYDQRRRSSLSGDQSYERHDWYGQQE